MLLILSRKGGLIPIARIESLLVSHFCSEVEHVSAASKFPTLLKHKFFLALLMCSFSLAQIELRIILAKLIWTYDFKLMDDNLDWNAANRSYVFWDKPKLPVQFQHRQGV